MRLILIQIILFPFLIFAQYFPQRITEHGFESYDYFYKSHYLNPFGLYNFNKIGAGFISHPLVNIQLNPANITQMESDLFYYLDFRRDRIEYKVHQEYGIFSPLDHRQIYPPVYHFSNEKIIYEPNFSFALITKPIKTLRNFNFGLTFQLLNKSTKFYQTPTWIYVSRFGYDPFGNRLGTDINLPVYEIYSGKDEMITNAKFYSAFAGYKLNERFSVGLYFNGISHNRDGQFLNQNTDDFGNIDDIISSNYNLNEKSNKYIHYDINSGLIYQGDSEMLGIKLGILSGKANQSSNIQSNYFYQRGKPDITQTWSHNFSDNKSIQSWDNSGNLYYAGFNLSKDVKNNLTLFFNLNYIWGDIDFSNKSLITDTSNYYYRYRSYNEEYYKSRMSYLFFDDRFANGTKSKSDYAGSLGFNWKLGENTSVSLGIIYNEENLEINSSEPTKTLSISYHRNENPSVKTDYLKLIEDKNLKWNLVSKRWSYEIPVVINYLVGGKHELMFVICQSSTGFDLNQKVDAVIYKRERIDNDSIKVINNFIERYNYPRERIVETDVKFMVASKLIVSKDFLIRFLFEPYIKIPFILSQWWLSFEGKL